MHDLQKKTAETFDEYQQRYSEVVNDAVGFTGMGVDFFTRVKAGYIAELAVEHFGSTQQLEVLDIGCGVGNFHGLLQPVFSNISGVDVSEASVEHARSRHPSIEYKTYDGRRLPYDDASFDIAFTICVMHHVPPEDWTNFAAEMKRVLKPGGLALVFEHNPRNPLTMRAVNTCPFDEDAVLLKSTKTVSLLDGAGFETTDSRFILSIPAGNRFLRRIDRLFSRLPFGAQYYVAGTKEAS